MALGACGIGSLDGSRVADGRFGGGLFLVEVNVSIGDMTRENTCSLIEAHSPSDVGTNNAGVGIYLRSFNVHTLFEVS